MLKYGLTAGVVARVRRGPADKVNCGPTGTTASVVISGLPIYDTKGGIRSYGAGAQARYLWTPQWATHVFVEYERLSGEPADSPLVTQKGSPDQVTIGFGVTRSFDIKTPW